MSEYQFYEWQSIARPLTAAEQSAVGQLSSHIEVSATSAWVEYHWSGFKHDPLQVLARYFDAFLYYANWGTRRLAFRFPRDLVDEMALQPYLWHECASSMSVGEWLVLVFDSPDEDGGNWFEGPAHLASFTPLRDDILAGDLRVLYLAWLLGAGIAGIDEEQEPPVPPGLGQLSATLAAFCAFFAIDPYLLEAAAEASPPLQPALPLPVDKLIARLPRAECDAFLRRLAANEPMLALKLNRRLAELADQEPEFHVEQRALERPPRRTWAALQERAAALKDAAVQRKNAAAEAARIKRLQALALRERQAWTEVYRLIELKQARPYDDAVDLLCELCELAVYQNESAEFEARITALRTKYAKRPSLLERMKAAGLA